MQNKEQPKLWKINIGKKQNITNKVALTVSSAAERLSVTVGR